MPDARPEGSGVLSIVSRDRDRERLEREIRGDTYEQLLKSFQRTESFYRHFSNWPEVIAFMRQGSSRDPRKDLVLRPICQAHRQCPDPRWTTILLVIFWPGLASIWRKMRSHDSDSGALWRNVLWAFTQVVYHLDPQQRLDRLVQKIYNDTIHRVRREYQAQRERWENVDPIDSDDFDESTILNQKPPEHEALVGRCNVARQLDRYRRTGFISDSELDLLIGTIVYGESLRGFADRKGLSYDAAKKRRQRAAKKIRFRKR